MNSQKKKNSRRSVAHSAPSMLDSRNSMSVMKSRTRSVMSVHAARMTTGVRKVVSRMSHSEKPSTPIA